MALATGWERATIRRQPAGFMRALIWRLFAARLWDPELATFARSELHRAAYPDLAAYGKAAVARSKAAEIVAQVEGVLWPKEGDDG